MKIDVTVTIGSGLGIRERCDAFFKLHVVAWLVLLCGPIAYTWRGVEEEECQKRSRS